MFGIPLNSQNTKIDGIILNKFPYRERDLVLHLLLRSGHKLSLMVYGGRGGGKKMKPALLEPGYLARFEISPQSKELCVAKEYSLDWRHEEVRNEYQAFLLMSFYLELIDKVAPEANLKDSDDNLNEEYVGLFRVLSNALFYLDHALKNKVFSPFAHLELFLIKMSFELGVAPAFSKCTYCSCDLAISNVASFEMQHGGFSCANCMGKLEVKSNLQTLDEDVSKLLWDKIIRVWQLKYQDYGQIQANNKFISEKYMQYLCYQFQLDTNSFKSFKMLL